jgi:hypothetical protein
MGLPTSGIGLTKRQPFAHLSVKSKTWILQLKNRAALNDSHQNQNNRDD